MLPKTAISPTKTDIVDFVKSVNEGSFYEDFLSQTKSKLGKKMTRKDVKVATYQTLFSDNRWRGHSTIKPEWDAELKELFISLYPNVYEVIKRVKKNDSSRLARLLQRIESYLIIDVCVKRIAVENPRCPVYTIHDSISTVDCFLPYVKEVIEEEFGKFVGVKPVLTIKRL